MSNPVPILQQVSFRGLWLSTTEAQSTYEPALESASLWGAHGPYTFHPGPIIKKILLRACVWSKAKPGFATQKQLIQALQEPSLGDLIHPHLGQFKALTKRYAIKSEDTSLGAVWFEIEWLILEPEPAPGAKESMGPFQLPEALLSPPLAWLLQGGSGSNVGLSAQGAPSPYPAQSPQPKADASSIGALNLRSFKSAQAAPYVDSFDNSLLGLLWWQDLIQNLLRIESAKKTSQPTSAKATFSAPQSILAEAHYLLSQSTPSHLQQMMLWQKLFVLLKDTWQNRFQNDLDSQQQGDIGLAIRLENLLGALTSGIPLLLQTHAKHLICPLLSTIGYGLYQISRQNLISKTSLALLFKRWEDAFQHAWKHLQAQFYSELISLKVALNDVLMTQRRQNTPKWQAGKKQPEAENPCLPLPVVVLAAQSGLSPNQILNHAPAEDPMAFRLSLI